MDESAGEQLPLLLTPTDNAGQHVLSDRHGEVLGVLGVNGDSPSGGAWGQYERRSGLAVVFTVLFLDSILLSCIVPIIPAYLGADGTSDWKIALLFSSKAMVQLVMNPVVAPVVNRIGPQLVLLVGTTIMISASIGFAFGTTFGALLAARAVQGIGSACSGCAGLTQVSQMFPEDHLLGPSMATATLGIGFGVILGPPYGGLMYSYTGKRWPFFVLAIGGFLSLLVQLWLLSRPQLKERIRRTAAAAKVEMLTNPPESIFTLLKDRNIRRSASTLVVINAVIAAIEPAFPIWAARQFGTPPKTVGLIFLAASLSYVMGTAVGGAVGLSFGRKRTAVFGLCIGTVGAAVLIWPGTRTSPLESIPGLICIGTSAGACEASVNPILASITEQFYPSSSGTVFAVADMCFALGFAVGPLIAAALYAGDVAVMYLTTAFAIWTALAALYMSTMDEEVCTKNEDADDTNEVQPSRSDTGSGYQIYEDEAM